MCNFTRRKKKIENTTNDFIEIKDKKIEIWYRFFHFSWKTMDFLFGEWWFSSSVNINKLFLTFEQNMTSYTVVMIPPKAYCFYGWQVFCLVWNKKKKTSNKTRTLTLNEIKEIEKIIFEFVLLANVKSIWYFLWASSLHTSNYK